MKVAIYVRVSRDDLNPDNQLDELRDYCRHHNHDVYKEYVDIASGARDSRPALDQMMKDGFTGKFNTVVIWKLDRLGRSLQHLVSIVNQWKACGINFVCTTQQFDTTTPNGKLLFHIFASIAEFERELISERTKAGLRKAKNVGKRGRDKKPRKKGGYYLRWQNKRG